MSHTSNRSHRSLLGTICLLSFFVVLSLAGSTWAQQPVQIQDGKDVTQGAKADASSTDHTTTNSLMSFLKGLVRMWNDVWDDGNNRINVAVQNTPTVTVSSSALPTGASTLAEQQTQTTALQLIDNLPHTSDAALNQGVPIFCQFDNTAPGTTTENNVRPVRCSTLRELFGVIRDAAGNERGANVNASNQLSVSVDNTPNIGTVTTLTSITNAIKAIGNVAHDGAGGTTDPVLTGCYASAAAPTDVSADTDATREWCLRNGARAIQPTFAGVLQSTGNGVAGTGTPRITIASDNTAFTVNAAQSGTWTVQPGNTANTTPWLMQGNLADDGAAAGANRVTTLPALSGTTYNSSTSGRNTALNTGAGSGLAWVAGLPEPSIASYSASATVASAASATDIAVVPGNATNTVLVTEVRVSCTQTTAGIIELHLLKRSTADTAGTSVGMTEVPDDANYAAASSALLTYTANPTTGSLVGDVDIVKLGCLATGTTAANDLYVANFRQKPIVLRGTAQQLAVNLNGVTVSGGNFAITFKWIETVGP